MQRAAIVAALLCVAGCGKDGSLVVVTIDGVPGGVAALQGVGTTGGDRHTFSLDVTPGKSEYVFGIQLAADLKGTLLLHVDALGSGNVLLASGDGQVSIAAGGRANLTIDLGAGTDLASFDAQDSDQPPPPPDLSHCTDSTQCPDDKPTCDVDHCVPCTIDGFAGYTTECTTHAATRPICNAGACAPCTAHSQCPAGICAADGSCPDASQIAYVDTTTCNSGTKDGSSPANAFCQIGDALAVSAKPYIHAAPFGNGAFTVTRTVTIVGAGLQASNYTTIGNPGPDPVVNFAASSAATVTLDGFSIIGQVKCTGGTTQHLVITNSQLTQAASAHYGIENDGCTLDVRNTTVGSNGAGGIKLNGGNANIVGCNINSNTHVVSDDSTGWGIFQNTAGNTVIDRCLISVNAYGGIWLWGTSNYSITNNVIYQNAGYGVSLGQAGGLFAFNTILDHMTSGVDCNAAQAIQSSIILRNPSGGPQVSALCAPSKVVVGSTTPAAAGKVLMDPTLGPKGAMNYALTDVPANDACCVDKGALTAGTAPDHDYYGDKRPLGAAPDVGATELK